MTAGEGIWLCVTPQYVLSKVQSDERPFKNMGVYIPSVPLERSQYIPHTPPKQCSFLLYSLFPEGNVFLPFLN